MRYSESKGRAARGGAGAIFMTALLIAPGHSRDVSHLERSLDDMQYRVGQIEGEMGKLKKTASQPGPAAKAVRSRADSLLPSLIARYDSLAARVAASEAAGRARASAPSPASPAPDVGNPKVTGTQSVASVPSPSRLDADTAARSEIGALRKEMRELTVLLQAARSAPPPAPPAPPRSLAATTTSSPAGVISASAAPAFTAGVRLTSALK